MSRRRPLHLPLSLLLAATLLAGPARADELKGKVKSIALKASVLSLVVEGQGVVVVPWNQATVFVNAAAPKDVRPDELVVVDRPSPGEPARTITRVVAKVPEGIKSLRTDEVAGLVGQAVIIDSRPASKFAEGHIPGAVNVPWAELDKQGASLLPADKAKPVTFYCGGVTCVMSPKSAAVAKQAGFADVAAYPDGEPGWKRSDRLLESTVEFARTGNAIILDLRDPAEAAKGHLPRAVSVPATSLASQEKAFPAFKGVPIVLHGAGAAELARAAEQLRDWDYTAVTALGGGLEGWKAAGQALEAGPLPTAIRWERKLLPFEVSSDEFLKAVKEKSAAIVDVRTAEEFARGHFPGAVNVPAETCASRLGELPKDRPDYVHCGTGARAEMAYDAAKEKGVAVKALRATVEFAKDGSWTIGG
jgi:rhodanese-related sulfurtransferase